MGPLKTAMIIDDDADLGSLLSLILEKRKIHSMAVQSLSEAEECLHFMKPTFVFLDNSFPDGLGLNFIKNIKSADADIKIIMMTGDTSLWIEQKAVDEGINFFLKKPLTEKNINNALDKIDLKVAGSRA